MRYIIDQDRINILIKDNTVEVLDIEYCKEFDMHISGKYPWDEEYKDKIDWNRVPNIQQINYSGLSTPELKKFLRTTRINNYEYLAIIYGASQPGVIGKFDDIVNNFKNLSFHTPWIEFIVGAKKNIYNLFELSNDDFIEVWEGKGIMSAEK